MKNFSVIVASDLKNGIGLKGKLPWNLPEEVKYFKEVTTKSKKNFYNAVIMGKKTYESIPEKFRPLKERYNVVLTSDKNYKKDNNIPESVFVTTSLRHALYHLSSPDYEDKLDEIFVIGGAGLIKESLKHPLCDKIYLTQIRQEYDCDTFIEPIDRDNFYIDVDYTRKIKEGEVEYYNQLYRRKLESSRIENLGGKNYDEKKHPEYQYLDCLRNIMKYGERKGDRTGTGTISLFGVQMRYSLRESFPMLTTKRVYWKGIVEELLWFIKGQTNSKTLSEKQVHIWDGNGSREFLDKRGLQHREEGDLGPVYGFQWRHFGAEYKDMKTDYKGQGVDQLQDCIDQIKKDPNSRRIIMSAWNPVDLNKMALPPCHILSQFYVTNGELSLMMYQRSADMGLGVPFNIASYSLLTVLVAHICGLKPGDFIHCIGDAHIYSNHLDALQTQLQRDPRPFPKLKFNLSKSSLEDYQFSDFELLDYNPHPIIKMEMSI
eukprot:TRINITY_DN4411_c0_g1_i1.p1 TRINITY_DN4411_c0_g1~~TRINITY_DN4411_c0_g1_i1.p1  ORF type:complete len:499 (+),score=108.65 TRINITY_DN4411_c0_g1_i1:34-1497(+)